MAMIEQQDVMRFRHPKLSTEIRINRADLGDSNLVFSVTEDDGKYHPGMIALPPELARDFARAILSAADVIEGLADDHPTYEQERERQAHERHVNLMGHCRLCRDEAGEQTDRLVWEED